ncbi:tetratricopeptide repeat protein [Magnetofaba australis]|uniref:Uncharacterized protein n=1 Tax=Magnetofaba australis IT-1 TaxID=1434232 RepID=A0A1Y2K6W7_9PROT|nr:tetratricopeptide repeat protein [Magnetofaba australis]OSM04181.1 hypothetical protein MAIT1_04033 [Magnetofaba australis IT-1]
MADKRRSAEDRAARKRGKLRNKVLFFAKRHHLAISGVFFVLVCAAIVTGYLFKAELKWVAKDSVYRVGQIYQRILHGDPKARQDEHFARGKEHLTAGREEKARVAFQNVLQINPRHVDANFTLASIYLRKRDLNDAVQHLQRILRLEPKHFHALMLMGHINLLVGNPHEALRLTQSALSVSAANVRARVQKAQILAGLRETQKAIDLSHLLISEDPKNLDAILLLGALYAKEQKLDEAARVFEAALSHQPEHSLLTYQLARVYESLDQKKRSVHLLESLAENRPESALHWIWLSNALLAQSNDKLAVDTLKEGIKRASKNPLLRMSLALLHKQLGDDREAESIFTNLIGSTGQSIIGASARIELAGLFIKRKELTRAQEILQEVETWTEGGRGLINLQAIAALRQGQIALLQKRHRESIAAFERATKLNPVYAEAYSALGKVQLATGSRDKAIGNLKSAVRLNNLDIPTRMLLAAQYSKIQKWEPAGKLYLDVLKIDNQNLAALFELARVQHLTGQTMEAIQTAGQIRKLHPENPIGHMLQGELYFNMKMFTKSVYALRDALAKSQDKIKPLMLLTRSYLVLGQPELVVKLVQNELQKSPKNASLQTLLGEVFSATKQYDKAIVHFEAASKLKPGWERPTVHLARVRELKGDAASAIGLLEKSRDEKPDKLAVKLALAFLYQKAERYGDAIREYEGLLEAKPQNKVIANNLAMLLMRHAPTEASLRKALQVASILDGSNQPAFLDTLGWAYYLNGRNNEAITILEKAVAKAPEVAEHHYHLGVAYLSAGQHQEAKQHLKVALKNKEHFYGVEDAIGALNAATTKSSSAHNP